MSSPSRNPICAWCDRSPSTYVDWDGGLRVFCCMEHGTFIRTVRQTIVELVGAES